MDSGLFVQRIEDDYLISYRFLRSEESAYKSSHAYKMANRNQLTQQRYLDILEHVVFDGHYLLDIDKAQQLSRIQHHGGHRDERGLAFRDGNGKAIWDEAEPWEADQFWSSIGDLQHELGPSSLTDHLQTLNLNTTDFELKRFYARTKHRKYPQYPKTLYQLPIRTLNG